MTRVPGLGRARSLVAHARGALRRWRMARAFPRRGQKLHVGCGRERLEGWINIDFQAYPGVDLVTDVTRGLFFQESEAVYAEHFLEHLRVDQAVDFLIACHRALRDGGAIRLTTPNLDWVWRTHYWLERDNPEHKRQMALALNRAFYGWEHRFLWNREMLDVALTACGFEDLVWPRYQESGFELFRGIERHETYQDFDDIPHVLIVEARKGAATPQALHELRWMLHDAFLNHLRG